jgi:hypothetical protein
VSEYCRQRYNIATGGGQSKPAAGNGAKPAYAKGGAVKSHSGVSHKSTPSGFKSMKGKC